MILGKSRLRTGPIPPIKGSPERARFLLLKVAQEQDRLLRRGSPGAGRVTQARLPRGGYSPREGCPEEVIHRGRVAQGRECYSGEVAQGRECYSGEVAQGCYSPARRLPRVVIHLHGGCPEVSRLLRRGCPEVSRLLRRGCPGTSLTCRDTVGDGVVLYRVGCTRQVYQARVVPLPSTPWVHLRPHPRPVCCLLPDLRGP